MIQLFAEIFRGEADIVQRVPIFEAATVTYPLYERSEVASERSPLTECEALFHNHVNCLPLFAKKVHSLLFVRPAVIKFRISHCNLVIFSNTDVIKRNGSSEETEV